MGDMMKESTGLGACLEGKEDTEENGRAYGDSVWSYLCKNGTKNNVIDLNKENR